MIDDLKKLIALFPRRDRWVFLTLVLLMIGGALMEVVGIGVVPVFVGVLASPERVMNYPWAARLLTRFGMNDTQRMAYVGSAALFFVFVLKNAYQFGNRYVQQRVLKNRQIALMLRLFRSYMHAPYEFHLQRNTAELLRNVSSETQAICQGVLSPLMLLIMNTIMTLSILAFLAVVNLWITIASMVVLGLAGGAMLSRFERKVRQLGKQAQEERREIVKTINQGLGSIKEIRLMRRESFFVTDLGLRARALATAQSYQELVGASTNYYLEVVAVATLLLICVMLTFFGTPVQSIAPLLALFGVALVRLKSTVSQMVSCVNTLVFQCHAIVPVHGDLRQLERNATREIGPNDEPHTPFQQEIELRDVTYRYPAGHRNVVSHAHLSIQKGTSVAFIGPTGAGKTTVVDIILGLLPPTQGAVLVDGVDIRENLAGWQRNIGYVPQTIYLTDDTIRHNVALGVDDSRIDDEALWTALRSAQLDEFVRSLPKGLDTFVGERGMRISGGQRQRVGIARALYHDPEVLVFDEGTSALDNETEAAVIDAIEQLRGTRTILMIAHRLTTVSGCDSLYKMENGALHRLPSSFLASMSAPSTVRPGRYASAGV